MSSAVCYGAMPSIKPVISMARCRAPTATGPHMRGSMGRSENGDERKVLRCIKLGFLIVKGCPMPLEGQSANTCKDS